MEKRIQCIDNGSTPALEIVVGAIARHRETMEKRGLEPTGQVSEKDVIDPDGSVTATLHWSDSTPRRDDNPAIVLGYDW